MKKLFYLSILLLGLTACNIVNSSTTLTTDTASVSNTVTSVTNTTSSTTLITSSDPTSTLTTMTTTTNSDTSSTDNTSTSETPSEPTLKNINKLNYGNGRFYREDNNYISAEDASLGYADEEFSNGYIEASVTNPVPADASLIFCITRDKSQSSFYEANVSYYQFFVSFNGYAYLGKITNGRWSALDVVQLNTFSATATYKIKVALSGTTIKCYVDDKLFIVFSEYAFLTGREFGIKTPIADTEYNNLVLYQ